MKAFSILTKISSVLLVFAMASCKKDNDTKPNGFDQFFRLKSYEVGVVPENRTVQVLFQVTDYFKKGVSTLTAADFIVSENDGRIDTEADIRLGKGSIPYTLKNVLLLDISRSVEGLVPQIKAAAKALIENKLATQEIAIYTFDAQATKIQAFTADKSLLLAAINAIPESNLLNSTNLYGAIKDVADLWQDAFSIDGIVDGSLIIFTDGRHNATQTQTLQSAKTALGTRRVYVAALASPDLDEPSLKYLAGTTDRYFKADDVAGLEKMFLSIQEEIQGLANSIYFLYYQSPITDPTPYMNKLKIEVKDNLNTTGDSRIVETFNSAGFGG